MRTAAALLLGFILLVAPGCHDYDRNDPDAYEFLGEFNYRADLDDYTAVDVFEWDMFHDEAFVRFEAYDFRGEMRLEIRDDHGLLVYDRTFRGDGGDEFHVDDTADGDDGDWTITITALDVDGLIYITVD